MSYAVQVRTTTTREKEFSSWLLTKLNQINVDECIFHDYILSVLQEEETLDDKLELIKSVLGGDNSLSETEINLYCEEILEKWQQSLFNATVPVPTVKIIENVDQKLAKLLESNVRVEETASISTYTDDELKIREAILSRYSQADESENDSDNCDGRESDDIVKNTNASSIHQAEKEKREKAKLENQKKKEKDKQDREKQKLTQQEKKEARRKRAQKVEHHRK